VRPTHRHVPNPSFDFVRGLSGGEVSKSDHFGAFAGALFLCARKYRAGIAQGLCLVTAHCPSCEQTRARANTYSALDDTVPSEVRIDDSALISIQQSRHQIRQQQRQEQEQNRSARTGRTARTEFTNCTAIVTNTNTSYSAKTRFSSSFVAALLCVISFGSDRDS